MKKLHFLANPFLYKTSDNTNILTKSGLIKTKSYKSNKIHKHSIILEEKSEIGIKNSTKDIPGIALEIGKVKSYIQKFDKFTKMNIKIPEYYMKQEFENQSYLGDDWFLLAKYKLLNGEGVGESIIHNINNKEVVKKIKIKDIDNAYKWFDDHKIQIDLDLLPDLINKKTIKIEVSNTLLDIVLKIKTAHLSNNKNELELLKGKFDTQVGVIRDELEFLLIDPDITQIIDKTKELIFYIDNDFY